MAKGRGQKLQGQAATPNDNHALKAKAAPMKQAKKEAATASRPSPIAQPNSRKGTANGFHRGIAEAATHAADGEEQRLQALQRLNMGPSDKDMSDDESGGPDKGNTRGEDSGKQNGAGPSQRSEREAYERALRRMEMGPSDDEEDESSSGGSGMDDDKEDDEGDGSSSSESGDRNSRGRLRGADQSKGESSKAGMQSGASRLRGMGYYEGSGEGEEGESSSESEDAEVGHGKVPKATSASQRQQQQQQQQQQGGGVAAAGKIHQENEGSSSDEHNSDSEGEEEEQDEEAAFLAELPLGERLALRTDGSGPDGNAARAAAAKAREVERSFKRANKHRPHEASSKKPVPRLREIIQPANRPGRDPRFAPTQTQSEKDAAAKRYAFVYDDMLPQDRNRIKTQLKQTRNERARTALSAQLQIVEQSMRAEQDRRRQEKIESEWKAKERGALEGGTKTKPFYLKKGEKKKMALMARFQELKEKGQLDKYMEKRRKRNASKDHKRIPSAGRG